MPILVKLCICFGHDSNICDLSHLSGGTIKVIWYSEYPLQIHTDSFETLKMFLSRSGDAHVVFILSSD